MKINSNSTAVITNNYLHRSEKRLGKSMERLSSGYKINNASDNPAGYAISSKMRAQIKSLEKATSNADQGIDFIKTGEGALNEVHDMLQRMNELAVKASNGTMTTTDREAIQAEVDQLSTEIERIARDTKFNDQNILDGNFQYRGYTDDTSVKVLDYSDETKQGEYSFSSVSVDAYGHATFVVSPNLAAGLTGNYDSKNHILNFSADDGTNINFDITGGTIPSSFNVSLEKIGAMRVQIGANEGQIIEMNIPEISLRKMGIDSVDMTTQTGARESIASIQNALDYTSQVRSKFGAYQNRMEHAINSLDVTVESTNAAYSTLVDTDMASEMTEYTLQQVLQQAGTSMLAQANEFPQQALQLLQ